MSCDLRSIREAVRARYAEVAHGAGRMFLYPTGAEGARFLGYPEEWIAAAPAGWMGRFCGVGNPFALGPVPEGASVLDIGCGSGFDVFAAARAAGPAGRVWGIDLTAEMAARAGGALEQMGIGNAAICQAAAEELPFEDASFDLVLSNGVFNLSPEKRRVFAEVARVLRPGGSLQFADIVRTGEPLGEDASSLDAWSQ